VYWKGSATEVSHQEKPQRVNKAKSQMKNWYLQGGQRGNTIMPKWNNKGTCTPMFIAALFTIAKLWKQPRWPTIHEWIRKMWYLYAMEFYWATKKNEILSFADKCMELKNIILSEVSQTQKAKSCMFSLICGLQTYVMKNWTHGREE
jgi:hypothetical protein